jgi:hypothetical protein
MLKPKQQMHKLKLIKPLLLKLMLMPKPLLLKLKLMPKPLLLKLKLMPKPLLLKLKMTQLQKLHFLRNLHLNLKNEFS